MSQDDITYISYPIIIMSLFDMSRGVRYITYIMVVEIDNINVDCITIKDFPVNRGTECHSQ